DMLGRKAHTAQYQVMRGTYYGKTELMQPVCRDLPVEITLVADPFLYILVVIESCPYRVLPGEFPGLQLVAFHILGQQPLHYSVRVDRDTADQCRSHDGSQKQAYDKPWAAEHPSQYNLQQILRLLSVCSTS